MGERQDPCAANARGDLEILAIVGKLATIKRRRYGLAEVGVYGCQSICARSTNSRFENG